MQPKKEIKPGVLCFVKNAINPENNGKIVQVIKECSDGDMGVLVDGSKLKVAKLPNGYKSWMVQTCGSSLSWNRITGKDLKDTVQAIIRPFIEQQLEPIGDIDPDAVDETLTWTEKPVKLTTDEIVKIKESKKKPLAV